MVNKLVDCLDGPRTPTNGTAERRTQLLEAGIAIFSRHSLSELSATWLAGEVGVSKALLFHYFGSKRGYYLAVVEEIAQRMELVTRPDPRLPLPLQLELAVRGFVEFIRDYPAMFRLLVGNVGADEEIRAITDRVRRIEVERVLEQTGIESPTPQLRTAVFGWVGFAETATLEWIDHRSFPEQELVDLILGAAQVFLGAVPKHRR